MENAKKQHIDMWVEEALYTLLEKAMTKGQITATDAVAMAPLMQMYQATQLEKVHRRLESLWHIFINADAGIYISTIGGEMDVNVKQMPQDKSQQPKKRS